MHLHVLAQQVVQRLQPFAHRTGPAPQRGPAELHALTAIYLRLTIMRRVLCELRRDDARQKAGTRIAALDGYCSVLAQQMAYQRVISNK